MSIRDSLPVCAGVLALSCAPAIAATDPSFEIEEIVVTALTVRDDAAAADAVGYLRRFSGETLEKRGIDNVTDLLRSTPGTRRSLDQGAGTAPPHRSRRAERRRSADRALLRRDARFQGAPSTTDDAGQRMPELRVCSTWSASKCCAVRRARYTVRSTMSGTVRALFNKPTSEFPGACDERARETLEAGDLGYEANAMVNVPLDR